VVGYDQQTGVQRVGSARRHGGVRRGLEVGLGREFDVPGEQRHRATGGRADHQRPLVHLAALVAVGTSGRGSEHLEAEVTEGRRRGCRAGPHHHADRYPRPSSGPVDGGDRAGRFWCRRAPDGRDLRPFEDVHRATGVVGVAVGEDQQVEVGVAVP
jgi:hypothetical protein